MAKFNLVIKNLMEIAEIFQYLTENFHSKQIIVKMTLNNIVQPISHLNTRNDIYKIYNYLLEHWVLGKLDIEIEETSLP